MGPTTYHVEPQDAVFLHQGACQRRVLLDHVLSVLLIAETFLLVAVNREAEGWAGGLGGHCTVRLVFYCSFLFFIFFFFLLPLEIWMM